MPNWVYTDLDIRGNKESLDYFRKEALEYKSPFVDEGQDFTFHAFLTPPDSKLEEYKEQHGVINGKKVGDSDFNWYEWNLKNWQTKWDACDYQVISDNDEIIQIRFETPWSPPMPVFEAMVKKFPALSFEFEWEEENEWGGRARGECGEFGVLEEWDSPNSHAEYKDRDKDCWFCEAHYVDLPEEWYADCPDKEQQITKQKMEKNNGE